MKKQSFLNLAYHLNSMLSVALVAAIVFSAIFYRSAHAASLTVTTTIDSVSTDGKCSLREAVIDANRDKASSTSKGECPAGSGADVIILGAGTYPLTRADNGSEDASQTGDLDITSEITIQGLGADKTVIDATKLTDHAIQVLSGGKLTLIGVTILGGKPKGSGGVIYNGAILILQDSVLASASAGSTGGGIYNAAGASAIVTGSTIGATLSSKGTAIPGNTATGSGGGIYNDGGSLTITNSTIAGNTSSLSGGGIYNNMGTVSLLNVTTSQNSADGDANGSGDGGGVFNATGNGIIFNLKNSILAGNLDKSASTKVLDCSGPVTSQGYNLLQNAAGCSLSSDSTTILNRDAKLAPLALNGGTTPTFAPGGDSPAIEAIPAANNYNGCPATDQRGKTRPQGQRCDIGAFELENPPQRSPYTVNIATDSNDGSCTYTNCSLREALLSANAIPNGASPDLIQFNLPGTAPYTLALSSPLPAVSDAVIFDATTQPGYAGTPMIALDGSGAGENTNGFTIQIPGVTVKGFNINGFSGSGIDVLSGTGSLFTGNQYSGNGKLAIDLGGDGVTQNDVGVQDADSGANNLQNFPVITAAYPAQGSVTVQGRLDSGANQSYKIEIFDSPTCDPSQYGQGKTLLGELDVTTDGNGNASFKQNFPLLGEHDYITATTTGNDGTSEFSRCLVIDPNNTSWMTALIPSPDPASVVGQFVSVNNFVALKGQSRWFKFHVIPNSKVIVTLTGLPANYDLTLYKDIQAAYQSLTQPTPEDLNKLGAEFAADAFSADAFSADAFSADAFSADAFSADAFSADAFSPDVYTADQFSADAFSADAFSADAFSADAFSADAFSADAFSADAFSPDATTADAFSADAFSGAQLRSLLGVSAHEGTASEGLVVNTWENDTDFYVRVRGRNGNFDLSQPFSLNIMLLPGSCKDVQPVTVGTSLTAISGNFSTLILANPARMDGTQAEKDQLAADLSSFAGKVNGVVVDVGQDERVSAAFAQADTHPTCPYAMNQAAQAIQAIVNRYRQANNSLEYIQIAGSDNAIPFFRHPDHALLGNEKNYIPPVLDNTPSQASLKLGYVLSQDDYGATTSVSIKDDVLPIPDLAVGRLVETPGQISSQLQKFTGAVLHPTSALVTGYDFLSDSSTAIKNVLQDGLSKTDALIQPREDAPSASWTAANLSNLLLTSRHDLIYLAGHFSASTSLAADYTTRLSTSDLLLSPVDLQNAIVFSAGCHSGYNIVDAHIVPNVTRTPDWAVAFGEKGATLIAGTGYQYGDTDFIEYSERLYLEFSRKLRAGSGPVAIGKALVEAKQAYLAGTAELRPIHQKVLLESTLFGFPMLSVDMPGTRGGTAQNAPVVSDSSMVSVDTNPGATFGLQYADITLAANNANPDLQLRLAKKTTSLDVVGSTGSKTATYLVQQSPDHSRDFFSANPAQPVMPLVTLNVSRPDTVLRGVGFFGGSYSDLANILPLTGAATSDMRGVHPPFNSSVFFPVQTWLTNYYDVLANGLGNGLTQLNVLPAQFLSDPNAAETGTLRQFSKMTFRLFYNNNTQEYANGSVPSLSAAPSIQKVTAIPVYPAKSVTFVITVLGNPRAGIQDVWVTYTSANPNDSLYGQWKSRELAQNPNDSTQWIDTLDSTALSGADPKDVRYMVQAVNGVGLVSLSTNIGRYWTPGQEGNPTIQTALAFSSPTTSGGPYGTLGQFSAVLVDENNNPLAGQVLSFNFGPASRVALTGSDGTASVTMPLLGPPGDDTAIVAFPGTSDFIAAAASRTVTVVPQDTDLALSPDNITTQIDPSTGMSPAGLYTATLTAPGINANGQIAPRSLGQMTVFFQISGPNGNATFPVITDYAGRAPLPALTLPGGSYNVTALFGQKFTLPDGSIIDATNDRYNGSISATALLVLDTAPVAVDDAYSTNQDTPLEVPAPGVLVNDTDPDPGAGLTAVPLTQPAHGALSFNPDGSFTYTPNSGYSGNDSFTYQANDGYYDSNIATATITIVQTNHPPVCSGASANPTWIWPPNGTLIPITIQGVTDPDSGDKVNLLVTRIFQDEPVITPPDATGVGTGSPAVLSERDASQNGRVYHIFFTATDSHNATCSGEVRVAISHDQGQGIDAIDGGALYDSTVKTP